MRNPIALNRVVVFLLVLGMRSLVAQAPSPVPDDNPEGNTGALKTQIQTGGSYDAHSGNATRIVNDLHVPGALGMYGLDFTRYWNSVPNDYDNPYAVWPNHFGASGWSHSWEWNAVYAEEIDQVGGIDPMGDGGELIYTTSITITFPDGHATKYKITRSNRAHGPGSWIDGRWGAPYRADHGETNWPNPGGIYDLLRDMDYNGVDFWLDLADGGSVHFVANNGNGEYQAKTVVDPHGFRTELTYENGYLKRVTQEGGNRWLTITRKTSGGFVTPFIASVETGGYAGSQRVDYGYSGFPGYNGAFTVLTKVIYHDDQAQGQDSLAVYTYGTCYGDTDPCSGPQSTFPLLKRADDPHFAGPMRTIRYNYRGSRCEPWQHPQLDPPDAKFDYFYAQPETILAEESGDHVNQLGQPVEVSRFYVGCFNGTRSEINGFGAWRTFFFGGSAGTQGSYHCLGFQLAKLTDFTYANPPPANLPFVRQNYLNGQPREVWDGRGHKSTLIVTGGDSSGQPGEIHHPDGSFRIFNRVIPGDSDPRDPERIHTSLNHWLFSQTDERNQVIKYTRDERRRVKRIDYPDTSWESYTYNAFNQIETHRLPTGAVETWEYDPNTHRLTLEHNSIDGWAARIEYVYDDPLHPDLPHKMIDGRARINNAPYTVRMEYNGRNKVIELHYPWAQGGPDPTVYYEYDKYGNCIKITDELNHRKEFTYDSYRRCTSYTEQVDSPGCNGASSVSRRWDWIYDRVIEGVGARGAFTHTGKEWRVQIEPAFNADGDRRMTAREFDMNNRITLEQTGWIQPSGPIGPNNPWYQGPDIETHRFTYDGNGQKSSYTDPRQRVTAYVYDNRNRLWKTIEHPIPSDNGAVRTTETYYNSTGDKILVIFPDQKTQQWPDYGYDAFGQPHIFIDERGNTTNMDYWRWGPMKKLATVTTYRTKDGTGDVLEHQLTRFYYDAMGRPQHTYFPDDSYEYTGYEFGQVNVRRTRRGATKTIFYDARGREYSHKWNDGMTSSVASNWDDANRLKSISNNISVIDYTYDSAGQILKEKSLVAGGGYKELNYCRYPSGDVSQVTYPDGFIVKRTYTARGQIEKVRNGAEQPFVNYTYFPDGKVKQQDYLNGVKTRFGYDGRGFINLVQHAKDATHDLARRNYWRDDRDRITAWTRGMDSSLNGMEDGRGDRYQYDAEGQLEIADYRALHPETATPEGPKRRDHFYYDQLGNRRGANELAHAGTVNFTRKNNGLNQYSMWYLATNYDDDVGGDWGAPGQANGVLMQDGNFTASFNALNQPMAIWSPMYPNGPSAQFVWFGYDPLGRCVKRWVSPLVGNHIPPDQAPPANTNPATYFYYDGWNLVQEGSNASPADRTYVHGGRVDEVVASKVGGQWYYHHYDARGHCIMLTTASGGLQEQYDYDAFGHPYFYAAVGTKLAFQSVHTRFLFTGREYLTDLGIYDFRNRMYQPELGRFLQPDPKQFDAGDYNLYRYCHNDPVNKSDPTGLKTVEFGQYRPVLGSWIPQWTTLFTVVFNPSIGGNYSNPTPQNNSKAGLTANGSAAHGKTEPSTSVRDLGSNKLEANLSINVWVNPAAAAKFGFDRIAGLEKEHVYGGEGYKMKGLIGPGGFWDQEKAKIGGSISVWRWQNGAGALSSQLSEDLGRFNRAQHAEMDARGGSHDLPPF